MVEDLPGVHSACPALSSAWDQQRTENTEDFSALDPTVVAGIFALVASLISVQYIQHAHTVQYKPALSDAQDLAQGI